MRRRRGLRSVHAELRRTDQRATVGVDLVMRVHPPDVVLQRRGRVLLTDGPEEVARVLFRHLHVILAEMLHAKLERAAR